MEKKQLHLIAKTLFGLEELLADEIKEAGGTNIAVGNRAVEFDGDLETLYRVTYTSRTAIRTLVYLTEGTINNEDELYDFIQTIPWDNYLKLDETFAINAVAKSPNFTHSQYVAQKSKDAIVDQFRDKYGSRPSVDIDHPTLLINLHVYQDKCQVSFDASGESLHKRNYRKLTNEAPINEVLAAGMILLSGWDKKTPFVDPTCGSGTLLIEACLIARNIPPQFKRRHFGFMNWKGFNPELWDKVKKEAREKVLDECPKIFGSDIEAQTLKMTRKNLEEAEISNNITLFLSPFEDLQKPFEEGLIICNPPYGERMGDETDQLYKAFGDNLKQNFSGYSAWMISSNKAALKHVGLRPSKKMTLFNGSLECKFQRYDMYSGSKKAKHQNK